MKREYAITLDDAGADARDVERYWRGEPGPADFVRWFAEKYDLASVADFGLRRAGRLI